MPSSKNRIRAYLYLLLSTILWGAAFVIVEPALDHTSTFLFLFYRFGLAAVLISPLLIYYVRQHKNRRELWRTLGIETVGVIIYLPLLYEGLARSTAIETSLLTTTSPVFIIIACIFILKEKQTRREWTGLGITVLGMIIITLLPLFNGRVGISPVSFSGNLLIVLANVVGAIHVVLMKLHYKKVEPFFAAAVSFWLGAIAFGILSMITGNLSPAVLVQTAFIDWQQPSVAFAAIYMALFGSIIGLTAYIKGQKLIEASEASLFTYLQPLIYLPLGVFMLGENLSIFQILGLAVILAGVWMSETRR